MSQPSIHSTHYRAPDAAITVQVDGKEAIVSKRSHGLQIEITSDGVKRRYQGYSDDPWKSSPSRPSQGSTQALNTAPNKICTDPSVTPYQEHLVHITPLAPVRLEPNGISRPETPDEGAETTANFKKIEFDGANIGGGDTNLPSQLSNDDWITHGQPSAAIGEGSSEARGGT